MAEAAHLTIPLRLLAGQVVERPEPIEWAGGDCPVAPRTLVQVQCAFETEFDYGQLPRRAEAWGPNWRRDPGFPNELAITHYLEVAG